MDKISKIMVYPGCVPLKSWFLLMILVLWLAKIPRFKNRMVYKIVIANEEYKNNIIIVVDICTDLISKKRSFEKNPDINGLPMSEKLDKKMIFWFEVSMVEE